MRTIRTIGILGGSFNPAHAGHVHLSRYAKRCLRLDTVWWMVSPHNPLKEKNTLADYTMRLNHARQLALGEPIKVCDFEAEQGLRYSIDTMRALQKHYPQYRFIWLMGSDNLAGFHRWSRWKNFFSEFPIAVFDRAPHSHQSLRSKAALRYRLWRVPPRAAALWATRRTPCWSYIFMPRRSESATRIRKILGKSAFLRHNDSGIS